MNRSVEFIHISTCSSFTQQDQASNVGRNIITLQRNQTRFKKYNKSIRMIFMITFIFLLMNSPLAICKIRYSIQEF